MKNLGQFIFFKFSDFAKDKKFMVTEVSPWQDYNTKQVLGSAITVVIIEDDTDYGKQGNNLYEKFKIKVRKQVNPAVNTLVMPCGNVDASIYGDYRNMLSVTCDDVRIIDSKEKK